MRYHIRFLFIVLITLNFSCEKNSEPRQEQPFAAIRVAGYLYSDNFWNHHLNTDLSLLTDLNLAFINPDEDGNFMLNSDVSDVISRAHAKNVTVYASLGGAASPVYMLHLLKDDKRAALVNNLVALTEEFGFDCVDVDLEGDFINEHYADFIAELHAALKLKQKRITAALATWNGNTIHDTTLAKFDFINVMSYDKTGPWNPSNAGPHSPYEMALADANYYIMTRGVDAKKILVGLPLWLPL